MRKIRIILALLLPMLIILGIGVWVFRREGSMSEHLRRIAVAQLQQVLQRPVTIGRVRITLSGRVELDNVTVADRDPHLPPVFEAKQIVLRARANDMLTGGPQAIRSVRQVTVTRPVIRLRRDRQGVWNIQDLLQRKIPPGLRFTGRIGWREGRIEIRDQAPEAGLPGPHSYRLTRLAGQVDAGDPRNVVWRLTALGPDGSRLAAHGDASPRDRRITAAGRLLDVEAARWARYAIREPGVSVLGGRLDIRFATLIDVRAGKLRVPDYAASVRLRDLALRHPQLNAPLTNIRGTAQLAGRLVDVDVSARWNRRPLTVRGRIGLSDPVQLALHVESPGLEAAQVRGLFGPAPWPIEVHYRGPVAVSADVVGSTAAPVATGRMGIPELGYGATSLEGAQADLHYAAGRLDVIALEARSGGGAMRARGWFDFAPSFRMAVEADLREVALSPVAKLAGPAYPATGSVSGPVSFRLLPGGKSPALQPHATADLTVRNLTWGLDPIGALAVRGEYDAGSLRLRAARLDSRYGVWLAAGTADAQGALDLTLAGSDIDVGAMARLGLETGVRGSGSFVGTVAGTLSAPVVSGDFAVRDGVVRGNAFDLVTARLTVTSDGVAVERGTLQRGDGQLAFSGQVTDIDWQRQRGQVTAQAELRNLDLERFGADGARGIGGVATGRVEIGGSLEAPTAQGELSILRPRYQRYSFDRAEARAAYADGTLTLDRLQLEAGPSRVAMTGTVKREGPLDLQISAADFLLQDVTIHPPEGTWVALAGPVSAAGTVTGTYQAPALDLALNAPRITAQGEPFTDLEARLSWRNGRLAISPLTFADAQGAYRLEGWIATSGRAWEVTAQTDRASLGALHAVALRTLRTEPRTTPWATAAAVLRELPRPVAGALIARLVSRGEGGHTTGEAEVTLDAPRLGSYDVPTIHTQLNLVDRVLTVREFLARQGEASGEASGTVDLDGDIALGIDLHNLNADLFTPWIKSAQQLRGSADLTLEFSGPTQAPQLRGSAEIAQAGIGTAVFDAVRVARFGVTGGQLRIDDMVFTKGRHRLEASGYLPFSWSPFGIPRDQPLSLNTRIREQDLGLIASLVGLSPEASGRLNGDLRLDGTRNRLRSEGLITVADGSWALGTTGTRINALQAELRLHEGQLEVARLQGKIGEGDFSAGGTVNITTYSPSRWNQNRFDLRATGRNLDIAYGEAFRGRVGLDLALTSREKEPAAPTLSGQMSVSGATLAPLAPENIRLPMLPLNPALEVDFNVGPEVWLRSSAADLRLVGSGRVRGRVDAPLIDANLVVERGEISFPATPARVTRGTVVASAQPNAEGQLTTRIMVDILAEARIGATRIFIPMTGPLDNLRMDPYSIPTMTRDEIMAMLLGQEAWAQTVGRSPSEAAALSSVATGLISAGLGMTFLRPVEHLLAQSLNLEEFTILYSGQQPIRLRMGRYLAANLYLTYTTIPLGAGDRSDSLRLSYQITPRFSVGYSIIHRAAGVGTQAPTERRLEIDSSFRF